MGGSGSRGKALGSGGRIVGCLPMCINGGNVVSAGNGKVEGGLGFANGGHFVDGRGREGDFVGVVVVDRKVVLGRKDAFEHNSEFVNVDRRYGMLLIPGLEVGLGRIGW